MTEPTMSCRRILVVTIDTENTPPWVGFRREVTKALEAELAKKKHKLGKVHVHCHAEGPLEVACWNLAREIKEAASDAVNERIR